jgi:hypothetical protein
MQHVPHLGLPRLTEEVLHLVQHNHNVAQPVVHHTLQAQERREGVKMTEKHLIFHLVKCDIAQPVVHHTLQAKETREDVKMTEKHSVHL